MSRAAAGASAQLTSRSGRAVVLSKAFGAAERAVRCSKPGFTRNRMNFALAWPTLAKPQLINRSDASNTASSISSVADACASMRATSAATQTTAIKVSFRTIAVVRRAGVQVCSDLNQSVIARAASRPDPGLAPYPKTGSRDPGRSVVARPGVPPPVSSKAPSANVSSSVRLRRAVKHHDGRWCSSCGCLASPADPSLLSPASSAILAKGARSRPHTVWAALMSKDCMRLASLRHEHE